MTLRFVGLAIGVLLCAACGPSTSDVSGTSTSLASGDDDTKHKKSDMADPVKGADLGDVADLGDGTVTRVQCTSTYGTELSAKHGRLDGTLVSIVAPSSASGCNRDTAHVHLQVLMNSAVYDVAVDIGRSGDEIYYLQKDVALPDGSWSEGWHTTDALSYESLGVTSGEFAELAPTNAAAMVETALADVSHISVFGTGYNANGMHLIHYESGEDGALVLEPESATPQLMLFRFSGDTF